MMSVAPPANARDSASAAVSGGDVALAPDRARWLLLAALVLGVRKPDAFINPQFWAEDFWPFFVQADTLGPSVITWPYNGYLHGLPRLIAFLAVPLHPGLQPAFYVAAALAVTLGVVALALSPRLDLPGKPCLALAIVAVPHTGEIFLNPTNLQWITALGLVLVLLRRDPVGAREWVGDAAVLVFAGFTGPFSVLLWPLFVARGWLRRTWSSWVLAGVITVPAVVQVRCLWSAAPFPDPGAWHWGNLVGVLAVRLPMTLACGERWPVQIGYAWTVGLGGALTSGLVFVGGRAGRWSAARRGLLLVLAILLAAGIKRARPDTWAFFDTFNGDRYFYAPKVIAIWLLVLGAYELRSHWARWIGGVFVALAVAANVPAFRFAPLADLHWGRYADRIQAGERVEVPINPGWKVVYPGRPPR